MQITLTDTDGKEVLADTDMIKSLYDRGPHRELTLHFVGMIKIKETIPEIFKLIKGAKNGN